MEDANLAYPQSILAPYKGQRPPAPGWYEKSVAHAPEQSFFEVAGAAIEMLTWGEQGKPGLLFLHGDSAHAHWYSFICPFFADRYRCAAISFSGMGASDRRDTYSFSSWADEAIGALDAAGFSQSERPVLIAHSLGGSPAMLAAKRSGRFGGVICIDSVIVPPHIFHTLPQPRPRPHKLYTTQAEALRRFRFMPETLGGQHYLVDHVARHGMHEVVLDGQRGWQWCFDPMIWGSTGRHPDLMHDPRDVPCRQALLYGDRSTLIQPEVLDYMRSVYPENTPFAGIPEAGHHVMVDQPLALVASLRAFITQWKAEGG